jgi:hypothetical protein
MRTVEQEQDTREIVLPPSVQGALGELVNAAKDGLLALSVGVGLGVLAEMMEADTRRRRWAVLSAPPRARAAFSTQGRISPRSAGSGWPQSGIARPEPESPGGGSATMAD